MREGGDVGWGLRFVIIGVNKNMPKKDYSKLGKDDLLKVIEKLESRKKYGLIWDEEKVKEQFEKDAENALPVLKEISSKEIIDKDTSKPVNILIEGDNYHALSVLNFTHQGKIDVIYIDPPYNTGQNDFKYNDQSIQLDDVYRHSKWLSFMSKRLRLANTLLKDDGIIFISIDDNESAQLKLLCNEIFGEDNLLDTFYVQVRYADKSLNEKDHFQKLIEQVLVYAKNKRYFVPNKPKSEYDIEKFRYKVVEKKRGKEIKLGNKKVIVFKLGDYELVEEEKGSIDLLKGTWASGSVLKGNTSGKFFHDYLEGRKKTDGIGFLYKVYGIGDDGIGYRYFTGPKKATTTKGLFYSGVPLSRREELKDGGQSFKERPIVNFYDFSGDFGNIRHEGGVDFRTGKKPTRLIKQLVNIHQNKNSVILDFFAGSGSTGHAVLKLNKEDGGNRSFIVCTNNENGICEEICYPRIKNVIKGHSSYEAIGGSLKYFKTKFVKKHSNGDDFKMRITNECTEMLCLREGVFDEIKKTDHYRIFQQGNKTLAVYYPLARTSLPALKKEFEKIGGEKTLYCFTLDPVGLSKSEFTGWHDVTLEPIPQKILDVYKQIYEY